VNLNANAKRHLNTKPLYFSVSKACAKEPATPKDQIISKHLSADKKGIELIDRLGASNKTGSTVITASGKNYNTSWNLGGPLVIFFPMGD
jgi:hypothetical protein